MTREFCASDVEFVVANYRPRHNEFEKGLKYILLRKIYDGSCSVKSGKVERDYVYHDTGMRGHTIKECRIYAIENARYMQ